MPPARLDAAVVRVWLERAVESLSAAREVVDGLNVYPVPDQDTGSNMTLTMRGAAGAAVGADEDVAGVLTAAARGAVTNARGNSGAILAQLLLGFATEMSAAAAAGVPCDGRLGAALARAADEAYAAVARPVEGTALTVARAAADSALARGEACAADVVEAACAAAADALDRTVEQHPVLAEAGVVDAGGLGLLLVLDALAAALTGDPPPDRLTRLRTTVAPAPGGIASGPGVPGGPDTEVMYLLDAADTRVAELRRRLDGLGDSLLVAGGDGLFTVHVHVDLPQVGAVLEAGIEAGRPHRIAVTGLTSGGHRHGRSGRATVVLDPGRCCAPVFEREGCSVVGAPAAAGASAEQVLAAVLATGAAEVAVLPNSPAARAAVTAAAEAARAHGVLVAVVPTRSSMQGIAAVAVRDDRARFEDDVVRMTSAAAATRTGEIQVAVEEAHTSAGTCVPGDVLGLIDGDVAVIARTPADVALAVVDRLLSVGGELVTLVAGAEADPALTAVVERHVHGRHPAVETAAYAGLEGLLLVGVE